MKISVIAAGRLRKGPLSDLADDFLRRMPLPVSVKEIDTRARKSGDADREMEERFLAALPEGATIYLLDETGKSLSSTEFADEIKQHRDSGTIDHLTFIIGGPNGHGPRLYDRAHRKIALGRMTWPHLLARIMLLEQLYRAQSIWAGSPYHRE